MRVDSFKISPRFSVRGSISRIKEVPYFELSHNDLSYLKQTYSTCYLVFNKACNNNKSYYNISVSLIWADTWAAYIGNICPKSKMKIILQCLIFWLIIDIYSLVSHIPGNWFIALSVFIWIFVLVLILKRHLTNGAGIAKYLFASLNLTWLFVISFRYSYE